ncbi:undecaprenyl-diphosphate phosphatase, partial [Pseudomonas aeruginosa]
MEWWTAFQAFILGVVEGLTEFLPISSTGHQIIVADLIGFGGERAKAFNIIIQLAAILAVVWEFRGKIFQVVRDLPSQRQAQRFTANLLIAFFPAVVLGVLFADLIHEWLFNPITVALALVVGGVVMLWAERRKHVIHAEHVDDMTWKDALKIGCAQCLAMVPGTSRSGATIIGGLLFGLSRKAATEFSFFLAMPTMVGA